MDIAAEYLQLVEKVGQRLPLPNVQSVHIARYEEDPDKSSKFGALILTDGTVGLTYTGLDGALRELQDARLSEPLVGASPLQAARLFVGESPWQRSLGLAAINAISQFAFQHCACPLPATGHTIDSLDLHPGDHVGMVGYFPPLVESIRALALPLTVVELDQRLWCRTGNFEVTEDAGKLRRCNKILCTGTVLVNHTADEVLQHCTNADTVLIAGPTVGCLPDPLFARGVTLVGGCTVTETAQFLDRWRTQTKWRKSTRRYVLDRSYPGCDEMLRTSRT
jgi:uncharacterized protein (DUF4213/DUF364 family)